jgi:hypothetical protein
VLPNPSQATRIRLGLTRVSALKDRQLIVWQVARPVFCGLTPCDLVYVYSSFGRTCCLHHQYIHLPGFLPHVPDNSFVPSSGQLRGVRRFETDVLGLPVGPIFKGQDVLKGGTDR